MINNNPISSFVIDKTELTQDEMWKLLMFCASPGNLNGENGENWEVDIVKAYDHNWVNGGAKGEDTGKFWQFLVKNGMDDKIEIIRG